MSRQKRTREQVVSDFRARVIKPENGDADDPTACWFYAGSHSTKKKGGKPTYPRLRGFDGKNVTVCHFAYELENGPLPEGFVPDHVVCHNKLCIRYSHMQAVPDPVNTRRAVASHPEKVVKIPSPPLSSEDSTRFVDDHEHIRKAMDAWVEGKLKDFDHREEEKEALDTRTNGWFEPPVKGHPDYRIFDLDRDAFVHMVPKERDHLWRKCKTARCLDDYMRLYHDGSWRNADIEWLERGLVVDHHLVCKGNPQRFYNLSAIKEAFERMNEGDAALLTEISK